jgi:single-strand DNA-binding protein
MASYNRVILIGNLTRDPELRYTPKGTAIARIGMAMNRSWKSDSGEARDETTFVDVDAFGRQAEVIAQYMRKGRPLMIEGRLRLDSWDDKNSGQKRNQLRVVLEQFTFLDSGGQRGDGGSDPFQSAAPTSSSPKPQASSPDTGSSEPFAGDDDDVPF